MKKEDRDYIIEEIKRRLEQRRVCDKARTPMLSPMIAIMTIIIIIEGIIYLISQS